MTSVVGSSTLSCCTWPTAYQGCRWPTSCDAGIESSLHTAASDRGGACGVLFAVPESANGTARETLGSLARSVPANRGSAAAAAHTAGVVRAAASRDLIPILRCLSWSTSLVPLRNGGPSYSNPARQAGAELATLHRRGDVPPLRDASPSVHRSGERPRCLPFRRRPFLADNRPGRGHLRQPDTHRHACQAIPGTWRVSPPCGRVL